jgi:uncharacterized protein (DUF305 family)
MTRFFARRVAVAGTTLLAAAVLGACGNDGGMDHNGMNGGGTQPSATVPATGDFNAADVTFATNMIPHHQQALEMAEFAATKAANAQVKELAGRIQKAQDPEIATMSGWLREWGQPVPTASGSGGHAGTGHSGMPGMMSDQEMKDLMAASGADVDRMFLQMMVRHHQGAIEMALTEQQRGKYPDAKKLAEKIAADQTAEINEMQDLLTKL